MPKQSFKTRVTITTLLELYNRLTVDTTRDWLLVVVCPSRTACYDVFYEEDAVNYLVKCGIFKRRKSKIYIGTQFETIVADGRIVTAIAPQKPVSKPILPPNKYDKKTLTIFFLNMSDMEFELANNVLLDVSPRRDKIRTIKANIQELEQSLIKLIEVVDEDPGLSHQVKTTSGSSKHYLVSELISNLYF